MKTVAQFPSMVVDGFEAHGLFRQHFREIDHVAAPLDLAVVTHAPDRDSRLILHLGKFGRIGAWGAAIEAARCLSGERLMAALPVIFLLKRIVVALLLTE